MNDNNSIVIVYYDTEINQTYSLVDLDMSVMTLLKYEVNSIDFIAEVVDGDGNVISETPISAETVEKVTGRPVATLIAEARERNSLSPTPTVK